LFVTLFDAAWELLPVKYDLADPATSRPTRPSDPLTDTDRSLSIDDRGSNLRPEIELLLKCAGILRSRQVEAVINRLVQSQLDWPYLIATASRHGLLPLLSYHLQALGLAPPSKTMGAQLRRYFILNARRNLFLSTELLRLMELFATHGIRALAFKGPLLAMVAYGSVSLREFSDLDVLIAQEDVMHAKELLRCREYYPHVPMSEVQEELHLHSGCERVFVRADKMAALDLHWNFAVKGFSFSPDLAGIWTRLEPLFFAGQTVPTLSRSDMLLLLCVHGAKHHWNRLEWISSVAELLRRSPQIDWDAVMQEARRSGAERMLLLGLLLAKDLSHVFLPASVSEQIKAQPVVDRLARDIQCELFRREELSVDAAYKLAFLLQTKERLRDKVHYGYYMVRLAIKPTSRDRSLMPLPYFLRFFYYFVRPFRLVHDYGMAPLFRFIGRLKSF
jgi:hypothetical protein